MEQDPASVGSSEKPMAHDHDTEDRQPSVLLVEDDPVTQTELARALSDHGARVVGTGSGEAALALLEQWDAGLVVVSDTLSGMSGLEVARRIHASSPGKPVVLMRARGEAQESEAKDLAARLAGVFATLRRPASSRMLAELVVALVVASDVLT
jgi:CheY-like chemotaxis protein